jgi:tetratricopeptide (TPR) repeat protein
LLREALAIRREVLPADHPDIAMSLNNVAFTVEAKGSLSEAEAMFREALDISRRRLGNEHPEVATKLVNVALVLQRQRKWQEAEPSLREAIAIRRKVLGPDHPALANPLDLLADSLSGQGRNEDAVATKREAFAIALRALGEKNRETARLHSNLAWALMAQGAHAEAESIFRKLIQNGSDRQAAANGTTGLAFSLYGLRDYRAAEIAAREALELARQKPTGPSSVSALDVLGATLVAQRRFKEAEPFLREAHDIFRTTTARLRTPWYKPDVDSTLGAALAGLQKFEEAEPLLVSGYEGLRDLPDAPVTHLRTSVERLVAFYTAWGRPEQATVWRNRLSALPAVTPAAGISAVR